MGRMTRDKDLPALYFYVGRRVRQLREANGLSQDELARKIKLTRTSIVNFESGKQRIPLEDIYRIAKIFGVPAKDLLPDMSDEILMTTEQAFLSFLSSQNKEQ